MKPQALQCELKAIFSADAKGYSPLMPEDESIRTIGTYRNVMLAVIQKHRGRVVDCAGDNLLAEFPSVIDASRVCCKDSTEAQGKECRAS